MHSVPAETRGTSGGVASPGEVWFAIAMTVAFAAVVGWQVSVHELWRDEWNPWLIARHSESILDLFANKRYEAHPALWYLLLFATSRFAVQPLAMQWLHASIAVLGCWTMVRFAPFSRWERGLLCGGYFLLYEYAVLARDYGLAVLFVWAFCASVSRRPQSLWPAVILGLLAWTHALATMLSGFLGLWWLSSADSARRPVGWKRAFAVALLLLAVAGAAYDAAPPVDGGTGRWRFEWNAARLSGAVGGLADAFVPLSPFQLHFWNHHVLDPLPWVKAVAGMLLAAVASFACAGRRQDLALWAGCVGCLLSFSYLRVVGVFRHHGFLFVALVATAWLARSQVPATAVRLSGARRAAFVLLLALQLPGAAVALRADARFPFSTCGQAAAAVQQLGVADLPLVGETDVATAGVAGALRRPIHFVRGQRSTHFVRFDRERRRAPDDREIVSSARALALREGKDALLIMTRPLRRARAGLERLATIPAGVVEDERYILYLVSKVPPAPRSGRRQESANPPAEPTVARSLRRP